MFIIANVMMKLGSPDVTVSQPETKPSASVTTNGTANTTKRLLVLATPIPFGPAANGCSHSTPQRHAANSASIPTDKSISAQSNTNVRPVATIANTAPRFKTSVTVPKLRKSSTSSAKMKINAARLISGAKSASTKRREGSEDSGDNAGEAEFGEAGFIVIPWCAG